MRGAAIQKLAVFKRLILQKGVSVMIRQVSMSLLTLGLQGLAIIYYSSAENPLRESCSFLV